MIILDATTKSLQMKLGAAVATNQLPFAVSYVSSTGTTTTPTEQDGLSNNTTAVTIVSAPASSTQILVKNIVIQNADTASATVTIIYNNNSTLRNIVVATLAAGDQLVYEDGYGWSSLNSSGSIKTSGTGGGSGTVTTVSVASANGFAGTVANATTTPAITMETSITGVLKGNGTAISAATAGTDYQAPITLTTTGSSGAATFSSNTLNIPQYSGGSAATGTMFNFQSTLLTTVFSTTATSYTALTGLSVAITPTSSSNSVLVRAVIQWGGPTGNIAYFQLMRGSTPIGIGTSVGSRTAVSGGGSSTGNSVLMTTVLEVLDSPATTSATTYSVQGFTDSSTLVINATYNDGNSAVYSRAASTISVNEISS